MPSPETLMIVAVAGLTLSLSPGPSMLYVLSRSMGQSRSAGLASALGLGLGGMVLALAAAFGLAVVFQQSPLAYHGLKLAGALYLTYLGLGMLRDALCPAEPQAAQVGPAVPRPLGFGRIVLQGVLVEMLNPKTLLFFVAFLPQFINTETGDITFQMIALGLLVPLTALPSDLAVAFAGGRIAASLNGKPRLRLGLDISGGLILLAIACNLALQ